MCSHTEGRRLQKAGSLDHLQGGCQGLLAGRVHRHNKVIIAFYNVCPNDDEIIASVSGRFHHLIVNQLPDRFRSLLGLV